MNPDKTSLPSEVVDHPMPQNKATLRKKGFWLLAIFVIFAIVAGWIINRERNQLLSQVQQIQAVHMAEEAKLGLYLSVTRAVLVVNETSSNRDIRNTNHRIAVEINAVLAGMRYLESAYPTIAEDVAMLEKNLIELSGASAKANYSSIRNNLHKVFLDINDISTTNIAKEVYWLEQYFKTFDRLSLEWTFFALTGVVVLGSLVMIFLTRLGLDIQRIKNRTIQIIEGYRGEPLAVTRNDELGSLMEGINKMQLELRQQEIQVELSRQQQFHKEKMAAIGSLAAAVAHEINNPLSAIVGLSQEMSDLHTSNQCDGANGHCHPEMLLSQAKRVMEITRHISEFSTPQSAEPKLFDLNNLIRSTTRFISFDRRFRSIELALSLDPQIPAVYLVGDHITQVLMNLLINSADAMEGPSSSKSRIDLTTRSDENGVIITVADNGKGMEPAILARVFEEFFTTKPSGLGTGIGLALSKSLIESSGGSIAIESTPTAGTSVTIRLPVTIDDANAAREG